MTGLGTSQRRGPDDGSAPDRGPDDGSAPERQRSWQLWPPEISWDPGTLAARVRAAASGLTPAALWRNHRLFTIVACVSLIPRVIAALGFKPALLIQDSFSYLQEGTHLSLGQLRPAGYPMLLRVLEPFHSLLLVTTLQHLMGIGIGAIIYAVLRTRGLPAWGATLAAAPTLFDSRQIWLESSILPDTLFTLVLMIAVAILIVRPKPAIWQAVIVGLLVAWASVIRGNGAPVFVIILAFLLIQRVGWKVFTACLAAFAVPLFGYMLVVLRGVRPAQHHQQHRDVPVVADHVLRQLRHHQAAGRPGAAVPAEPARPPHLARPGLVRLRAAQRTQPGRLPVGAGCLVPARRPSWHQRV